MGSPLLHDPCGPRPCNVVVTFTVAPGSSLDEVRTRPPPNSKSQRNFYVCRGRAASFIVFPKSGNVVATGIARPDLVDGALAEFRSIYSPAALSADSCSAPRVVNATYSGRVRGRGGGVLSRLAAAAAAAAAPGEENGAGEEAVQLSFRSQCFPGARARWNGLVGTVNVFNNGKYIIVGVRGEEEACRLHRRLMAALSPSGSSTTTRPGTPCARDAA